MSFRKYWGNSQARYALPLLILFVVFGALGPDAAIAEQRAEVFAQLGHSGIVMVHAVSSDGRYILSGGNDNTLRLWDFASGREIRAFTGHTAPVHAAAFARDGRSVFSGSQDGTVKTWDFSTGGVTGSFVIPSNHGVSRMVFSPDGRYVLARGDAFELWDMNSKIKLRTFSASPQFDFAFSPDGKYVLSDSTDKQGNNNTAYLWSVDTGSLIQTFAGHTATIVSLAFSPDGKYALSGSADKTCALWDVATGHRLRTLAGSPSAIWSVAFSPDGRHALSAHIERIENKDPRARYSVFRLWDVATGTQLKSITDSSIAPYEHYHSILFYPKGRYFLSFNSGDVIKLWDLNTEAELRTFGGRAKGVKSAVYSPDGRYILMGGLDNTLKLWEVATARELKVFSGHTGQVRSVAFSPDGKSALSGSADGTMRMWDTNTGENTKTFLVSRATVHTVAFSPDGRYILSGSNYTSERENTLKLWDVATQTDVGRFASYSGVVSAAAFSPDGRYVVSGGVELRPNESGQKGGKKIPTLKVWETATGAEVWKSEGPIGIAVAFSPDGQYVLSVGTDESIKVWRADSGKEELPLKNNSKNGSNADYSIAFSPDGKQVLTGHSDNALRLWDFATRRVIKKFDGHLNDVLSVAFSPDGQYALSGSQDTTARIWNIATGSEIVKLIGFTDGEWIAVTPEGYYNSSANGDKYLNVRIGNNVYGIDQYRHTFYNPKSVEAALRGKVAVGRPVERPPEKSPGGLNASEPPFVVIKSPEDGQKLNSTEADISIFIEDRNQTIKSMKVYINGRLVIQNNRGLRVRMPEGQKLLDTKIPVTLDRGENVIEVVAFNGFSDGKRTVRVFGPEATDGGQAIAILPQLWLLSIGVNQYEDKRIPSLVFPADDASAIIEAFKRQEGLMFSKVNSLLISDKSSTKPSYANVLDNMSYLRKASQHDVVVLFIAGHGVNDESGDFYFLPGDAALNDDGSLKRSKAISWRDIKATLDLPSKVIVFVDACHSEGVSGKKTRSVDNDRLVKELQEANAVVFTSSRGQELSQESEKWGHGAFTYALIEGLGGKADLIKDGKITMKELDAFVSEMVPQITNGAQHPITYTPEGYINFPVGLIKQR